MEPIGTFSLSRLSTSPIIVARMSITRTLTVLSMLSVLAGVFAFLLLRLPERTTTFTVLTSADAGQKIAVDGTKAVELEGLSGAWSVTILGQFKRIGKDEFAPTEPDATGTLYARESPCPEPPTVSGCGFEIQLQAIPPFRSR